MGTNRTINAVNNIGFGFMQKTINIIVPFVIRTIMIYILGAQYLGLNSLFTSVLQVLNLAELGVGNAMVYSMYKPIAEGDKKTICALLELYRLYYRVIGMAVLLMGIIIIPLLPYLVKGEVPDDINVYIIYLLNLGATVLSYWLFAYKSSVLIAHQRNDILSKVAISVTTIQNILQVAVLVVWKNYYYYLVVLVISQIFHNVIVGLIASKVYPEYKPQGKLDKDTINTINKHIKDLFTAKLGGTIVGSVDTIVISASLGLTALAIYQNYYYIMTSVMGFLLVIFNSCIAGIGNSIVTESREKNYKDFQKLTFIIIWIAGVCTCCFYCLYQPFMELWVGPALMFGKIEVMLFCVYFYLYVVNSIFTTFKDAAGIWHEDKYRPFVTAMVNLILNFILVKPFGVAGILSATILSYLIVGMPWLIRNLFSILFKYPIKEYFFSVLRYTVAVIFVVFFSEIICELVLARGILQILIKLIICCVLPNLLFCIMYRNKEEFIYCIKVVKKFSKYRFK